MGHHSLTSSASVPGRPSALGVLPAVQVPPHAPSHRWRAAAAPHLVLAEEGGHHGRRQRSRSGEDGELRA